MNSKGIASGSSLVTGRNHLNFSYTLMGYKLAVITLEKDLCLTGESSIRTSAQCAMVVKEAKTIPGYIRENMILRLQCYCYMYRCIIFISVLNATGILMLQEFQYFRKYKYMSLVLTVFCLVLR